MTNHSIPGKAELSLLFRAQILEAQGSQGLGTIQVHQSIRGRLVAAVSLALGIGVVLFICMAQVTRKSNVGGIVVPTHGSLSVTAQQAGTLLRSFVREGSQVEAGARLFELSTERQTASGDVSALVEQQLKLRSKAIAADRRAKIAQVAEKRSSLKARLDNNIAERNHIDEEIELASNRLALAEKSIGKYAALQKSGFVSDAQTQQKEEDRLDLKARLSTLQRSRIQLQANKLAVESDLQTLETALAAELAALDKEDAALGQELLETQARKSIFIMAPQAGTVTTVTYEPGQSLNAGQPLATIVARKGRADTPAAVEVHLYAPSRTAGFVAPGQQVMLRFDAFPYQKFGLQHGVVASVSRTPFAPAELPANLASTILSNEQRMGGGSNEALYRIKVRLERQSIDAYGHGQPIVPGMTVSGDIVQERRSIWEWIIDPIVAATARQ